MAMIGCPACAKTISQDVAQCPHCGHRLGEPVAGAVKTDEFTLMAGMNDTQRILFTQQMAGVKKDSTIGVVLALFLGGLGAHHFYMGNILAGVLYVLFCWTFIPAILGVIEAFLMPGRVRAYNLRHANLFAAQIRLMSGAASPTVA